MIPADRLAELLAQVEAVLFAHLREHEPPGLMRLEDRAVWGAVCTLLDDVWQGEDPAPTLARIDPFPALRRGEARRIPEAAGWVLTSLYTLLTMNLPAQEEEQRRSLLFRSWLEHNRAAVVATVPAYPPDERSADFLNPALVQEAAHARHEQRLPRLARFLVHDLKVVGLFAPPPPRKTLVLETVGLLELPREAAEALEIDELVTEVKIRVREE